MESYDYEMHELPISEPRRINRPRERKKEWTSWNGFVFGILLGLLFFVCVFIAAASLDMVAILGGG